MCSWPMETNLSEGRRSCSDSPSAAVREQVKQLVSMMRRLSLTMCLPPPRKRELEVSSRQGQSAAVHSVCGVDDPLKSSFLSLPLISRLSTHEIKYAGTLSIRGSVRRPAVDLLPAHVSLSTLTNGVVAAASFLTTAVVLADQERSPEMGSQEYDGGGAFPHRLPPPHPLCSFGEGGECVGRVFPQHHRGTSGGPIGGWCWWVGSNCSHRCIERRGMVWSLVENRR